MIHDRQPIRPAKQADAVPLVGLDGAGGLDGSGVLAVPGDALRSLYGDIDAAGGAWQPDARREGAVGFTMFDAPASQDQQVTVLLADQHIRAVPSQALVRIHSLHDDRRYLGTVVAGPFAEPDGLRADSTILVTVVTRGGIFVPPYHGRVQVELLGEERPDGALVPPRYRPLPNSPVFVLSADETALVLRVDGDLQVGQVLGHEGVRVAIPSTRKDVLPRHTAILGTTGGGKSTTVARLVQQAQAAGCAVLLLDVEGEYTRLHEPTTDARMQAALEQRGLRPAGVPNVRLYHLVGRDTANPDHPARAEFCLQFARLSPYAVMEILDLSDAQRLRFLEAYDAAKALLRELGVFPERGNREQEQRALETDEFERGYPRLELRLLMDVVAAFRVAAEKGDADDWSPQYPPLRGYDRARLFTRVRGGKRDSNSSSKGGAPAESASAISWRTLLGKLGSLNRLRVFDREPDAAALRYSPLLRPGTVTVVDLSDSGSPVLNNLVIADLLRGVQEAQDEAYQRFERQKRAGYEDVAPPTRTLIVIEEAHEFLSAGREEKMPVLFEQVTRIARRGRKRWLGLVFVTQLPQHLPRQLFGLVNGYVLHKIADPQVVSTLQRTVSGIDESLWRRLPGLAPGQAIVAFPHLARPLLATMDPSPAELRLVD